MTRREELAEELVSLSGLMGFGGASGVFDDGDIETVSEAVALLRADAAMISALAVRFERCLIHSGTDAEFAALATADAKSLIGGTLVEVTHV